MNKQVICEIDGQFFGLDSLCVRSIETGKTEMSLGGTPDFVEGILKFRGEWVPIIRLRSLFHLEKSKEPELSQVIYLRMANGTIGFRVDGVVEIDELSSFNFQQIAIIENSGKTSYVSGACKHHDRLVVVIDHNKLLSQDDLKAIMDGIKAVYEAEEAEKRRKEEEEEAKRKAEEAKQKAQEEANDPEAKTEINDEANKDSTESTESTETEIIDLKETKNDEMKPEEPKAVEIESEDFKAEEIQAEVIKAEDGKNETIKLDDVKFEETKSDDMKPEETKTEEAKSEQEKADIEVQAEVKQVPQKGKKPQKSSGKKTGGSTKGKKIKPKDKQ